MATIERYRPPPKPKKPKLSDSMLRHFTTDRTVRFFEKLERGCSLVMTVTKTGVKTWGVMLYRSAGERGRVYSLEKRFPQVGLASARWMARKAWEDQESFLGPKADADTFEAVSRRWLAWRISQGIRTAGSISFLLERYIWPTLANVRMADITKPMLVQFRNDVASGNVKQGKPDGHRRRNNTLRGGARTSSALLTVI